MCLGLTRALIALASLIAVLLPAERSVAQSQSGELTTRARQAILMDADTGSVLFQYNGDQLAPPGNMSKLMVLALVFKAMKNGQLKPNDSLPISVNAWRKGGAPSRTTAMMIPVNTREPLDQLLQGIIVQYGNDAAIAVAEGIAGSEETFARLMAEEGRRIGITKSKFQNATGFNHPDHLMTARDLAKIAREIIREYPNDYARFAQKEFQYRKHRFISRNPLLGQEGNIDGMLTGYSKENGHGMVASASRDGRRLIVVVNGCATESLRSSEVRRLLDWGYRMVSEFKLFDAGEIVGRARVWGGDRFFLPLTGKGDLVVLLPKTPASQRPLRAEIIYAGPVKAPIRKGDEIGRFRVTSAAGASSEVPLYAAEDVETGGIMRRGIDSLAHFAFSWLR
jgi:serine-type D-Ala-D-Ala carboxypeptidase (penicillin-binding protein 5/6)